MKYIKFFSLTAIIAIFISILNCDTVGTSKIELKLSVPSNISKVHIAVYEGSISENNLLTKATAGAVSSTIIDVPASDSAIFLIVGENTSGLAEYYGISSPVNLVAGQTQDVSVTMGLFIFAIAETLGGAPITWNNVGASKYTLMYSALDGGPYNSLAYEGPDTSVDIDGGDNYYVIRAYYDVFDLYTAWSSQTYL